jgi:hypothetical protein
VLHLTRSRVADKSVEVQQAARMEELEEANAQLRAEVDAAQLKVARLSIMKWPRPPPMGFLKRILKTYVHRMPPWWWRKLKLRKTERAKL